MQEQNNNLKFGYQRTATKKTKDEAKISVSAIIELTKNTDKTVKLSSEVKRQQRRQRAKARRSKRKESSSMCEQAIEIAKNSGLILTKRGNKLYLLESPTGWKLLIRPGSRGLGYDPLHRGPLFNVTDNWNLLDVVQAVVQAVELS